MRKIFRYSAAFLLAAALPSMAHAVEDGSYDAKATAEAYDSIDDEKQQYNWNRWVCEARTRNYYWQSFFGASYYFRAGSGEGQNAQAFARLVAVRECEFRTGATCNITRQSDCEVRRY